MNCGLFLSGKPRPVGGELHRHPSRLVHSGSNPLVVVAGIERMGTEINYLAPCGTEPGDEDFLQAKPTVIGGNSYPHGRTESHLGASLSFR